MKPFWKILLVICVLAGGGFYWWKTQSSAKPTVAATGKAAKGEAKGAGKRGGGPIPVRTISVTRQAMPVVIDAVGAVESEHSVAVRPQVNGVLESVLSSADGRVNE